MSARVYVTRRLPVEALTGLQKGIQVETWPEEEAPVPRDTLLHAAGDVEGILCMLTDTIDEELLAAAPGLRIVANMAVGCDNIDVDACTRHGVMATNTPGVPTETVADLAFGLLLAVARRIPEAERALLAGQWKAWSPMFMVGRDVHGATLGILGLGRIGRAVARRARGFSMRVLYWDKVRNQDAERTLDVEYTTLDHLLGRSDYVVVLLPLTGETVGLIGGRELGLMKPTSVLVNVGRGPIVVRQALYDALVSKRIWGAGLDVFDHEPVDPDDEIVNLENVVALPHIGSASMATRISMAALAVENLSTGLAGRLPPNLVNPEVLRYSPESAGRPAIPASEARPVITASDRQPQSPQQRGDAG